MDDRTPTGEQQDTTVGHDQTDGTRQDATVAPTVTVIEAARILGVSVDAVRSRLRRGTLEGEKVEGEWHVRLSPQQDADRQPTGPTVGQQDATGNRRDDQQEPDRTATVVDLAPLAEVIDDLTRRNAELAATAAMWQTRAAHLEGQLKALAPGEIRPDTSSEAPESPESDDQPTQGLGILRAWFRRLLGS